MFGIVCDIDGVLVKEKHVISKAKEALSLIMNNNSFNIPIMFVTNGGNCTELDRSKQLSKLLNIKNINPSNMIVSHSPLKIYNNLKNERLLLISTDEDIIHKIAKDYNWNNYETGHSFINNHLYLFPKYKSNNTSLKQLQTPIHILEPFNSIIILGTPNQWEISLQLLIDILLPCNDTNIQTVKLYVANPDLVYTNEYCTPRLTTGAFISCLKTLYKEITNISLDINWIGKPMPITYTYAENRMKLLYPNIKHFYAIGDNPLSDIKGANEAGDHWKSILVRTGVYKKQENHSIYPADYICNDIYDAITYILNKES